MVSATTVVESVAGTTSELSTTENTIETSIKYPDQTGFVNDFAGIFTEEEKTQMESFITDFEKNTTAEIVVVTINSLEGLTIEQYTYELFNSWGIGKKDINNGILLLMAIQEQKLRIEVGLGLESVITNDMAKKIIDETIIPYFRESKYGQGAYEGVKAIAEKISLESAQIQVYDLNIYNGVGTTGIATTVKNILEDSLNKEQKNIIVKEIKDADRFNYDATKIIIHTDKDGNSEMADKIKDILGVGAISESSSNPDNVDITIIIGSDYTNINKINTTSESTSTTVNAESNITVTASVQWVNTGVHINIGDRIFITASGSWSPGLPESGMVGPDGSSIIWGDNFLNLSDIGCGPYEAKTSTSNWATLIGYIGENPPQVGSYTSTDVVLDAGRVFIVGSNFNSVASLSGTLWLNFNDDAYSGYTQDNIGEVAADVKVSSSK